MLLLFVSKEPLSQIDQQIGNPWDDQDIFAPGRNRPDRNITDGDLNEEGGNFAIRTDTPPDADEDEDDYNMLYRSPPQPFQNTAETSQTSASVNNVSNILGATASSPKEMMDKGIQCKIIEQRDFSNQYPFLADGLPERDVNYISDGNFYYFSKLISVALCLANPIIFQTTGLYIVLEKF